MSNNKFEFKISGEGQMNVSSFSQFPAPSGT